MNDMVKTIFGLLGGLAVFIYGMNMMSECLQKVAGEKMKKILALLTKNPLLGVIAGALTTAVLQSSSATTVMAIGFVSAGLMTLPQAVSIIIGANIGTTITAQIIAFKITDYIYVFVFLGFIVYFVGKSEKIKNLGLTVFAFGLLFLGIETMGSVMKPLASSPVFTDMIAKVSDIPILGVAVGTLMTLVVQSSSATIAVLQNFAAQPAADGVTSVLGLAGAIPILLGDNIGTTITALLASVGQSKDAKRTAVAHCIFNISGCLLFIWFVKPYAALIQRISTQGPEVEVISRQIANAHTLFNVTMTVIWIPLVWLMVKIVMKIVPDGKKDIGESTDVMYLDRNLIGQPAPALQLVSKEVIHCSELVGELIRADEQAVSEGGKEEIADIISKADKTIGLSGKIMEYLAELFSAGTLTEEQVSQTAKVMYVLSDVERIGSLCKDVANSLLDRIEQKYEYSDEAMNELKNSLNIIDEMYSAALKEMEKGGGLNSRFKKLLKKREEILDLDINMRKAHMNRVAEGKCAASLTIPFSNILHSIDRMGNSCVNIAEAVAENVDFNYFVSVSQE